MKEWQVRLEDIELAVLAERLTLSEGLDAACELHRTGLPEEYYEALGVEQ